MRKFFFAAAVAVAALFCNTSNANAAFAMAYSLDNGATFTSISDNGAGDNNPAADFMSININGLNISALSGGFNNISPTSTLMDMTVSGALTGPANLIVAMSVNGITTAPAPQTLTYIYTGSLLPSDPTTTMVGQTWVGANNNLFTLAGATNGLTAVPGSGSFQFNGTVPYSMTTAFQIVKTSDGTVSLSADLNTHISASPAPAGLLLGLAGMPLMGIGAFIRRRRNKTVA